MWNTHVLILDTDDNGVLVHSFAPIRLSKFHRIFFLSNPAGAVLTFSKLTYGALHVLCSLATL